MNGSRYYEFAPLTKVDPSRSVVNFHISIGTETGSGSPISGKAPSCANASPNSSRDANWSSRNAPCGTLAGDGLRCEGAPYVLGRLLVRLQWEYSPFHPQSPQPPELAEEHCRGARGLSEAEKEELKEIRGHSPPLAPKQ
jgi:hypothetical protein